MHEAIAHIYRSMKSSKSITETETEDAHRIPDWQPLGREVGRAVGNTTEAPTLSALF